MNKTMLFLLAAWLAACGKAGSPTGSSLPTVEALAADPVRLSALREQCQLDRARLGDALCNRVAQATTRRFLGDGKVPYTPPKETPAF